MTDDTNTDTDTDDVPTGPLPGQEAFLAARKDAHDVLDDDRTIAFQVTAITADGRAETMHHVRDEVVTPGAAMLDMYRSTAEHLADRLGYDVSSVLGVVDEREQKIIEHKES